MAMMRRLILAALAALFIAAPAFAQSNQPVQCNTTIVYDASANGSTRLVAAAQGTSPIYICGYTISSTSSVNVKLIQGTGTACATAPTFGLANITPAYQFQASTAGLSGVSDTSSNWRGLTALSGNDLCINTSAGVSVQAIVYYYQQRN